MDRRTNRKENYAKLRAAGFSREESNRLKGASAEKVSRAIETRSLPEKVQIKITQGPTAPKTSKGWKPPKPAPAPRAHHARNLEYKPMEEYRKKYLSKYSFIVSYRTKDGETQYITISSNQDMYKKEVLEKARKAIREGDKNLEKYKKRNVSMSTLKVEFCVVKEG